MGGVKISETDLPDDVKGILLSAREYGKKYSSDFAEATVAGLASYVIVLGNKCNRLDAAVKAINDAQA